MFQLVNQARRDLFRDLVGDDGNLFRRLNAQAHIHRVAGPGCEFRIKRKGSKIRWSAPPCSRLREGGRLGFINRMGHYPTFLAEVAVSPKPTSVSSIM